MQDSLLSDFISILDIYHDIVVTQIYIGNTWLYTSYKKIQKQSDGVSMFHYFLYMSRRESDLN